MRFWIILAGALLCQMDAYAMGLNLKTIYNDENPTKRGLEPLVDYQTVLKDDGAVDIPLEPQPGVERNVIISHDLEFTNSFFIKGVITVRDAPCVIPKPIDKSRLGDEDYQKSMTTIARHMSEPFSSGVLQLKHLVHLHLHFCKIEVLPEEIGDLTALRFLDLSSNFLKELPPSFAQLTGLEHLDLSCNQLKSPPNLITLSNLTVLRLQHFLWEDGQEFKINTNKLKTMDLCFLTTSLSNFDDTAYDFLWELVLKDIDVYWWVNVQPYATILTKNNMERNFKEFESNEYYYFIQNLTYPKMRPGEPSGNEFSCDFQFGFAKLDGISLDE